MPNRRTVLGASLGLVAASVGGGSARADASPEVATAYGKIRGVTTGGVHVFKGIPYGASTAGANRFMPPRKPEAWTGVRETVAFAGRSPQAPGSAQRPELANVWGAVDTLPVGEDCLTLHVWTAAPSHTARPTRRVTTAPTSPGATTSWSWPSIIGSISSAISISPASRNQ